MAHAHLRLRTLLLTALLPVAAVTFTVARTTQLAHASTTQVSVMEDDVQLRSNLTGTLDTMHALGVDIVKVAVYWDTVAPTPGARTAPAHFNATSPAAYPASGWAFYDALVRDAQADGMQVGFMLTGPAPVWAEGPGIPAGHPALSGNWKPSASDFKSFAAAVGTRYDGAYTPRGATTPLPRVSWWSIWNEPNYGPNLAPQAIDHNTVYSGATMYRSLLNEGWAGLAASGHTPSTDTILFGETAPRGRAQRGLPGNFSGTVPLTFVRSLYCVGANDRPLRGTLAASSDCPRTAAASKAFAAANPALFNASGYAVHPYEQGTPPNMPTYACGPSFCWNPKTRQSDPDYADFPEIPRFASLLDRLVSLYGGHSKFPIWNTEYGWWTNPPYTGKGALPPATAAAYMNWAEYLSYENPRIRSYDQYLLVDPSSAEFASGLELPDGRPKATFTAFQMPLYLPQSTASTATRLLVWGAARPAPSALSVTSLTQSVELQFQAGSHGAFHTLATVPITNPEGYFEVRQSFTASGSLRIEWTSPSHLDEYSRTVAVTIR